MEISVVMSAYNAEKYIKQSIDSILNQTFKDFEFIIVNDCSNDQTLKILQEYEKKDTRIKVIDNKENLGLTRSLNKALIYAKGKYIARMDADDISQCERFEKQYNFLEQHPEVHILGTCGIDINLSSEKICDRTVPLKHEDIIKMLTFLSPIIHPSVMFRKNAIQQLGNYNEDYRTAQDIELWFRCAEVGYKFANLEDKLIYYRIDDDFFKRKSFKSRMRDLYIKNEGYRRLKVPIYRRYGLLVPIIMAIMPSRFLQSTYTFLKKFDPR